MQDEQPTGRDLVATVNMILEDAKSGYRWTITAIRKGDAWIRSYPLKKGESEIPVPVNSLRRLVVVSK